MLKIILILIILLNSTISLYNSKEIADTTTNGCVIYISVQGNNNITCGSDLNNTCLTLDLGIQSCQNQSSTNQMTFYFGNGTYYLNENITIPFYNQSISLNGCSDKGCITILSFANMNTDVFDIIEPTTAKFTDITNIQMTGITFQDLAVNNPTPQETISFLKVYSSISSVSIQVTYCIFNTFTVSSYGSIFNLDVDDQSTKGKDPKYVSLEVQSTTFLSNSAVIRGGVLNAGYMINSNFKDCTFRNNQANSSGIVYSAFGATNFTNCIFDKNYINSQGLLTLVNQDINYITNCSFTSNDQGYIASPPKNSIVYALNSMIEISNTTFSENTITCVWIIYITYPYSYISNSKFINNTANTLVLVDYKSDLNLENLLFQNNKQPDSPYANLGFITTSRAGQATLKNINFIGNNGTNIYSNSTESLTISGITTSNNNGYAFLVCTYSNISISGTNVIQSENTAYGHPIECQPSCDIESTEQSQMCPISERPSITKPNKLSPGKIAAIIICTILGVALLVGLALFIRHRRDKKKYQRIQ